MNQIKKFDKKFEIIKMISKPILYTPDYDFGEPNIIFRDTVRFSETIKLHKTLYKDGTIESAFDFKPLHI